jgi:cytochrome b561
MRYSTPMRWLHWISALMVLGLLAAGFVLGYVDMPDGPGKDRLYNLHESFGVVLWCVVVARLILRQLSGVPAMPPDTPDLVRMGAALNHAALYAVLLIQPIVGFLANNAAGYSLSMFNVLGLPDPIGKQPDGVWEALFKLHEIGGWALVGLVCMHLAGAAYHGVVRRDGIVSRMM